jgi:hypothetical protein
MTSPHPAPEAWAHWWNELDALAVLLKQSKGDLVSSSLTREQAKLVVQYYLRQLRAHLLEKLAAKRSRRSTYRTRMRELDNLPGEIETAIEIRATGSGVHSEGALRPRVRRPFWRRGPRSFPRPHFRTSKCCKTWQSRNEFLTGARPRSCVRFRASCSITWRRMMRC